MSNITLNGVEYTPVVKTEGNRAVIVVDRGWIFAGDVTRKDGRIFLTNAVWLFRWEKVGFSGVIAEPKNADIRKIADLDIPAGAEVFCVPVPSGWGL